MFSPLSADLGLPAVALKSRETPLFLDYARRLTRMTDTANDSSSTKPGHSGPDTLNYMLAYI